LLPPYDARVTTSATVLAANNQGSGVGSLLLPIILVVFVALMFFSQRRRRAAAVQARQGLGPGAVVITAGGLHATVQSVQDGVASLEIAPGVVSQYEVVSIARVVSRPGDGSGADDGDATSDRDAHEVIDGPAAGGGTSGEQVRLRKLPPEDQPPGAGRLA